MRIRAALLATAAAAILTAAPAAAQLKPEARKLFNDFEQLAPQRAFALSADGRGYTWSGSSGADPTSAVNSVLKRCQEQSQSACTLYAVNNVVLNGRDWKAAEPPALPTIGRLRPQFYWQNKGPQAAAGLIVWSHGYLPGKDSSHSAPQGEVAYFTSKGYDLYRFDREWIRDILGDASDFANAVRQAKSMGYRRVILAGQSNGAWTTLEAVRRGAPADGVISVSAAHHGEVKGMRDVSVARSDWQQLMGALKPGPRIIVGRTDDASAAFAKSGVDSIVIAYPPGFSGHDAANDNAFPRKYGTCMHAFIESDARQPPCT
jgi:dienelactone hydrolase